MDSEVFARGCFIGAEHGLRSRAELTEAGLGPAALVSLVRRGVLIRVTAGYFALASPQLDETASLLRLGRALERRHAGRVVMTHHLALAKAGLPLLNLPMTTAHLSYRQGGSYRARADHVVHAAPVGLDLTTQDMPVAAALVHCGATWGEKPFVVAADAALNRHLVTPTELSDLIAARPQAAYHAALGRFLARLDDGSESPGESLLRLALNDLGYVVRTQVEVVARGRGYRLDMVIAGTRVAIEFDGIAKYATAADFRAEKDREENLRVEGWIIVRFQWQDLHRSDVIRQRIEWALAQDSARHTLSS